jgi:hypothetical protein
MEESDVSSDTTEISYEDSVNQLLEEQDEIISDLRDEVEILKQRIDNLKVVIVSKVNYMLNDIIEYL